jgi:hypothetical protein
MFGLTHRRKDDLMIPVSICLNLASQSCIRGRKAAASGTSNPPGVLRRLLVHVSSGHLPEDPASSPDAAPEVTRVTSTLIAEPLIRLVIVPGDRPRDTQIQVLDRAVPIRT